MAMVVAVAAMMTFLLIGTAVGKYSGGTGEPNDPFRIASAEDLNDIGNHQEDGNKHFLLVNDVNLAQYTGTRFKIIGEYSRPFSGVFDGCGHKISNFTYNVRESTYHIGLFGYVYGNNAEIKDLELIDPNISNTGYSCTTSSLVGYLEGGTVNHCRVQGGSIQGDFFVGGLVGNNDSGSIIGCNAICSVSGSYDIGGLVATNSGYISDSHSRASVSGYVRIGGLTGTNKGNIFNCSSTGSVFTRYTIGSRNTAGGLVGSNWRGTIRNCFSAAVVVGHDQAGGLVGKNYFANISCCSATGDISGKWHVGGLVGENWQSDISYCYSINNLSGDKSVGGLVITSTNILVFLTLPIATLHPKYQVQTI